MGLWLLGISSILIGPSILFRVPDKVWIIYVGISFNAIFGAWLFVPVITEIIDAVGV